MGKKQVAINIISNMLSMIIGLGIAFFLTPYIISNLGLEAYGFVPLITLFSTYVTMLVFSIYIIAARFIQFSYHRNNFDETKAYLSSTLMLFLLFAVFVMLLSIITVFFLDQIFNIPSTFVFDIQIMFILIMLSAVITIISYPLRTCFSLKNRLDILGYINITLTIIKPIAFIVLFLVFSPKLMIVGLVNLLITIINSLFLLYAKSRLLSEIPINLRSFDRRYFINIIKLGLWNVLARTSYVLTVGIQLVLANIFFGPVVAGTLAISKTLPSHINKTFAILFGSLKPSITKNYAIDENSLFSIIKTSFILPMIFGSLLIGGVIIFGDIFYGLWLPNQNSNTLHILTIIILLSDLTYFGTHALVTVFEITNNLKKRGILSFAVTVLSISVSVILLTTTQLGVYVIVGSTTLFVLILRLLFYLPLAAKIMHQKYYTLYPFFLKSMLCLGLVLLAGYGVRSIISMNNWMMFSLGIIITATISLTCNYFIAVPKNTRKLVYQKFSNKLKTMGQI